MIIKLSSKCSNNVDFLFLISPINSAFFFPQSHLEIQVSFFKFNLLDITLPALESIWIYCSSLMNLIVQSTFLLFCTRPYNTLNSPANMNVLNRMFSLFTQIHLCLLQCHPVGRRLNFTQGPEHVCLTFPKLLLLFCSQGVGPSRADARFTFPFQKCLCYLFLETI